MKIISSFFFNEFPDIAELNNHTRLMLLESNVLEYDIDIKSCLQLSAADAGKCINVLEDYKLLNVTPLILKKNPIVVETIKRLRRYVGNMKDWSLTDTEKAEFNEKAAKIRKLAELIYKNFKVIL